MKSKIEKAVEVLKIADNLRKVYDYELVQIRDLIDQELDLRKEQRSYRINCLEDMCRWLQEYEETEYTFYYRPQSPEQEMEAEDDRVTDDGFDKIRHQIEGKEKMTFEYEGSVFRVKSYIDLDKRIGEFEMEEILAKVEKRL